MSKEAPSPPNQAPADKSLLARWHETPLYLRIILALVLGVVVGMLLGKRAGGLALPSQLILRLLGALAPPLILVAVIHALLNAQIQGRVAYRLLGLLALNTLVAIFIGLVVANVVQPGRWSRIEPAKKASRGEVEDETTRKILETLDKHGYTPTVEQPKDPLTQFVDNVPKSLLGPLGDKANVLGVIFIAVAFGIALRRMREREIHTVNDLVGLALDTLIVILHWVIDIVPLGVFGIVASIVGTKGFNDFVALGVFIITVLLGLLLQATYYLTRIRFGSWVRPIDLLRGTRDALVMAFSTASSTATMPVTFSRLRDNVGLREESASLGALVGANFNNDGTALYEAASALFISQMIGRTLGIPQQLIVVLTSVMASVGAAGIPEAGLVTMTLVFHAVGLPTEYIPLLLTVDWFLDRCRTTINVMGDMNVSCLLDGKAPQRSSRTSDRRQSR